MEAEKIHYLNPSNTFLVYKDSRHEPYSMGGCHFHGSYEIFYLTSGERLYFIHDRTFHVKAGDILFINSQAIHRTMEAGKSNYHSRCLIHFVPQFVGNNHLPIMQSIQKLFIPYSIFSLSAAERNVIDKFFDNMFTEAIDQQMDYELQLQSYLQQFLIHAARNLVPRNPSEIEYISNAHVKISGVVRYLNEHYSEDLLLSDVAQQFNMSHFYLSRLFKTSTGFSFVEYLNSIRIKEAQQLLRDTDEKIADVAQKVGFENQSYFGKIFKEMSGTSPLQYRKELPKSMPAPYFLL